ncbi:MAG: hypothetical protein R3E89_09315 [Thiolinea sp.]
MRAAWLYKPLPPPALPVTVQSASAAGKEVLQQVGAYRRLTGRALRE